MNETTVALMLLGVDKSKRDSIVARALDDYFKILYMIACDIYDSCIQDFYIKYTPKVYDRHGNLEGFNLYRANEISYEHFEVNVFIDSYQLLPYGKEDSEDKRDIVLNTVMSGLRGAKTNRLPGWPKHWRTSYPNKFSTEAGIWSSSKTTLNGIFNEFLDNVMGDTDKVFWEIVSQKI